MFGKWLNEEELKSAKEKKKALKKRIRELSQSEIMRKLQSDLELSQARAQHFENEYFDLKRSLIFQADQKLRSELYEIEQRLKQKDENIAEFTSLIEKQADEITSMLVENCELKSKVDDLELIKNSYTGYCSSVEGISFDEANDQINKLLKPEKNGTENR